MNKEIGSAQDRKLARCETLGEDSRRVSLVGVESVRMSSTPQVPGLVPAGMQERADVMSIQKHTNRAMLVAAAALVAGGGLLAGVASASPVPTITTVAGNGTKGSSGDGGPAVNAELNVPSGVTEDMFGSLYIGDTANNKVRKVVLPTTIKKDIITTIAGTGAAGFSGDGGLATAATLRAPTGVAVDTAGDVFVADTGNSRIREIKPSGIISTFAGTGSCSSTLGNGGQAIHASLCVPTGIALDHAGKNLFIADTGHNVVREVNVASGIITAFAGTGSIGSSGDGGSAVNAKLAGPSGVATNSVGAVYIADTGNSKVRVVTGGVINTFAGTGKLGFGGDGGAATKAQLSLPTGLGVDPSGNVFISDTGNSRIREVNTSKIISTYAGTGRAGFSGDGGPATAAMISIPTGAVAADGSAVYFSDTGNQRVRGIFVGPPPVLPQSNLIILLPVSAGLLAGGSALLVVRRRRRTITPATS
jgi:NHL repeat